MNQNIDNINCIQLKVTLNDDAIRKYNDSSVQFGLNWSEQPSLKCYPKLPEGYFDTVLSQVDYIELKTKTEQDKKSGLDKQIQATITPIDLVNDNQNSIPAFVDRVASSLSADKCNNNKNR